MKEYTCLSIIFAILTLLADKWSRVNVFKRKEFYLFIVIILGFKFLVNGYLTQSGIVVYNPEYFLGIRLGSIPLEDFIFGFSLVSLSVIFWEKFKEKREC